MFGDDKWRRRTLQSLVTIFREKGATNPQSAMTAQELGLPARFEGAMKRRLGSSGIFVEISGKYYLDESRLKQIQAEANEGITLESRWSLKRRMLELRIARMVLGVIVVALVLYDLLYVGEAELRILIVGLLFVWLALTLMQLYLVSRIWTGMGSAALRAATEKRGKRRKKGIDEEPDPEDPGSEYSPAHRPSPVAET